jgi:phospholipase A1
MKRISFHNFACFYAARLKSKMKKMKKKMMMMKVMKNLYLVLVFVMIVQSGSGQTRFPEKIPPVRYYNADSIRTLLDEAPYFSLFKDNYFIGGMPVGQLPSPSNTDVKFQLSISQRLTKSRLPLDTYLFIQYTQKAFWDVLRESLPMREMNYNPGIGLGHLLIYHNNYIGKGYLMMEHESNGKDSIFSRSWNKLTLSASITINKSWETQFKVWAPFTDGENNKDILRYNGIGQFSVTYRTDNKRFTGSILLTKRISKMSSNTQIELSYKFNDKENQYLFLQYYNGYGENLLEYNQYKSIVRIGFVIKPSDFSFL